MRTLLVCRLSAVSAFLLAGPLLLGVTAPAWAAERSFPVGDFAEVVLLGSPDVEVRTGVAPSVVAQGEAADLERLDIRVEGNRLVIGTKRGSWNWASRRGVQVRVGARTLTGVVISGSGDMSVDRVSGPFSGRISGSGDMRLSSIDSDTLTLAISGSGDMTAAGRCGAGTFSISGSGDIDAGRLACRTLTASISGSGDIDAAATDTATLRVSGSGDIAVTGGARCTTKSTGSGTTSCR